MDAAPSVQNIPPEARALLAGRKVMDIELRPLRDAYFDHQLSSHGPVLPGPRADPAVPAALALVAVLILALAAVNYVNLATVRVLRRQREVAMRKVLGAGAGRIARQFVAEALLLSLLATALGLLLAWLVLPLFSQLMNRDLSGLMSWSGVGAALALGVVLGLLTALNPVLVALRVHPSRVLAGRPDTESRFSVRLRRVLNALAARQLGWSSPQQAVGQTVLFTNYDGKVVHKRIVGIAPELRFHSLREAPRATAYELWTAAATLGVRASVPLEQAEDIVRQLWPRYFPDAILKTHRAASILDANYADDARLARLLAIASGIALLIAACGTYALSAHSVQRRAREIVLRKLHGAGRAAVGLLMVREAAMLLLLAALAGLPVAAVVIQRYLSAYVERAPIGGWPLLLAAALTTAVSAAAIARQAWIAMRMQLAQALRG